MRNLIFVLLILHSGLIYSQRIYKTSGGELIFSRSVNNSPFLNTHSQMRVSAFLHFNNNYHFNFSKFIGCFSGISISNIGFAYKDGDTLYKRRTYNIGVPVALKFGKLDQENYLFAGAELEAPFHYKQKKIDDSGKDKYSAFFDNRVRNLLPSVFAGIQFSGGYCFKFRLYLTDYLNKNFKGTDFGLTTNYSNTDSKLFLLSLSFNLKENKIKKIIKNEGRFAASEI